MNELTKEEIEEIIDYEIVVDCYSEDEVNMGWAIYMEENLHYPFEAEYVAKKTSGKEQVKKVKVIGNKTDESNFDGGDYYVEVELDDFIVPARIDDLKDIKADEETMIAIQVWNSRHKY